MRVELIHPPHPQASEDRLDAPLGLLCIAANLEKHGHKVRVNDLSGMSDWNIGFADFYGITCYAPTIRIAEQIAHRCRTVNPDAVIVAGGAHPSAVPVEMSSVFNAVVIGEGEQSMLDVLDKFSPEKRFYECPIDSNLDQYPDAAYHLIDPFSYKRTFGGEQSLTIITSRGCPYRCAFCGLSESHKIMKYRSPERVAAEIRRAQASYGIHKFNFQDDTFTVNKPRLHEMLRLFKPLDIGFRVHGRAGLDTPRDYQLLKEAGCEVVAWGIESGSQRMLDRMNKRVTIRENEQVIEWAKDSGFTSRVFIMLGFPGENEESVHETIAFLERTDPDQIFINSFVPFPGTDVWNHPEKYGVLEIKRGFENYYQIDGTGFGSRMIVDKGITNEKFFELEKEIRMWLSNRKMRGYTANEAKLFRAKL